MHFSLRNLPVLLFILGGCLFQAKAEAKPPNIVLVITDDQGYGPIGRHGHPWIRTPHLDKLYDTSTRFTRFLVSPTCAPTRSALMTGRHPMKNGVTHTILERERMTLKATILPQVLKQAGYTSGIFGKWHLGDEEPHQPHTRGFDEAFIHGAGGIGQAYKCSCADAPGNKYFDPVIRHNGSFVKTKGFCTDLFFTAALGWIKQKKDGDAPFFAYITTNAPHGPMHAPVKSSAPYVKQGVNVANFFGMISNIDDNVGAMRAFLKEEGLTDNTIFIFTTDNGTSSGAHIHNNGMRGKKGSEYDGGHRVPFFIHWPKGGLTKGRDVDMITSYVDIVPTLIDYCNVPTPKGVKFDGVNIRPLIEGRQEETWPDRILVTDSQRVRDPIKWRKSAVMTDQWRLVNGKELFDINADPGQKNNLAKQHPAVVSRLAKFYEAWWQELVPTFGQPTAIYIGHPRHAHLPRLDCRWQHAVEPAPHPQRGEKTGQHRFLGGGR